MNMSSMSGMDMSSMSGMSMSPTSTAAASAATTAASMAGMSHDHDGMQGMDMACSMDMLTNWKTIGSCFLTSSWKISTEAQFAGTCVGVFLMVVSIEAIRRWGREWDRYILRRALAQRQAREAGFASAATASLHRKQSSASDAVKGLEGQDASSGQRPNFDGPAGAAALESLERVFYGLPRGAVVNGPTYFRPTILQQSVRSIVYAVQYIGAYIIMLIAMSFNGYILISIALGGLVGHFISTWDNLSFEMDSGADAPVAGTAGGQASSIDATLLGAARSANQPDGQQQQQQQQQRPATAGACCSTAYEGGASCCG